MSVNQEPKWRREVEEILRSKFQGEELSKQLKKVNELINLTRDVEIPSGDSEAAVAFILKLASQDLYPLAAVYAGFQLGVAWERYQNANRA